MTTERAVASLRPAYSNSLTVLLIHRGFPGQLAPLAETLTQRQDTMVWSLAEEGAPVDTSPALERVRQRHYAFKGVPQGRPSMARFGEAVGRARAVARALMQLKTSEGLAPDLVIAHLGWGESLHIRSVFKSALLVGYCEWFHAPCGRDSGFDPEFSPRGLEADWNTRELNAVELLGLHAMDLGIAPTEWQRGSFPAVFRPRIRVIHEGVATDVFAPDAHAVFSLPEGRRSFTRADKILTFATSSLEPYRGIHVFLRALPEILNRHPDCQVVIAGQVGDSRYGATPEGGGAALIETLMAEAGIAMDRLHWVGFLNLSDYRALLQVSSVHVYLTVPFVLSWSLIEAMAVGCTLVASDTAPVREVLTHKQNALLIDFHDPKALARAVVGVLDAPASFDHLGKQAREDALLRFDRRKTQDRYQQLVDELLAIRPDLSRSATG